MKSSEKKMILVLIIVAIIIIAVLVKVRNSNNEVEGGSTVGNGDTVQTEGNEPTGDEFVEVLEDGTKLNVSDKLSETKTFGNYEISNIQLTEQNGQSLILADVKNIGEAKSDVLLVDITLLDKEGNEITTIGGIIGDVEPGATVQLNASATTDFANAYDFTVKVTE